MRLRPIRGVDAPVPPPPEAQQALEQIADVLAGPVSGRTETLSRLCLRPM